MLKLEGKWELPSSRKFCFALGFSTAVHVFMPYFIGSFIPEKFIDFTWTTLTLWGILYTVEYVIKLILRSD